MVLGGSTAGPQRGNLDVLSRDSPHRARSGISWRNAINDAGATSPAATTFPFGGSHHRWHSCGNGIGTADLHAPGASLSRSHRSLRPSRSKAQCDPEHQSQRHGIGGKARRCLPDLRACGPAALHSGFDQGRGRDQLHADDLWFGNLQTFYASAERDHRGSLAGRRCDHPGQGQHGRVRGRLCWHGVR